jgi:hypothetical protein
MPVKTDIKYIVRDFIGVNGGEVRLKDGQTFGEFLKNKRYASQNNQGVGETDSESKDKEGNEEKKGDAQEAV